MSARAGPAKHAGRASDMWSPYMPAYDWIRRTRPLQAKAAALGLEPRAVESPLAAPKRPAICAPRATPAAETPRRRERARPVALSTLRGQPERRPRRYRDNGKALASIKPSTSFAPCVRHSVQLRLCPRQTSRSAATVKTRTIVSSIACALLGKEHTEDAVDAKTHKSLRECTKTARTVAYPSRTKEMFPCAFQLMRTERPQNMPLPHYKLAGSLASELRQDYATQHNKTESR